MTAISVGQFEWDAYKDEKNREKHKITFEEAAEVFDAPYLRIRSDRGHEVRWIALGVSRGRVIAVIYTQRGDRIRIISARRARTDERESYKKIIGNGS